MEASQKVGNHTVGYMSNAENIVAVGSYFRISIYSSGSSVRNQMTISL